MQAYKNKKGSNKPMQLDSNTHRLLDPMNNADEEIKDRQFVTALARGLELLRCFGPKETALGNQELAHKTGLPKPTVSRLTHTLTRLGYLKKLPNTSKYQLDVGVLAFGYRLLNNLSIKSIARPLMEDMAKYAKAAVAMAARDRLQMVYLDVVHGEANLTMRRQAGSYLPIHASSVGRACLAAMPESERDFILNHLKTRNKQEWPAIQKGLEQAFKDYKEHGYCLSLGDWHREVNSVAVPMIDNNELIVFNCGGPSFHLSKEKIETDIGPRLVNMVSNIQGTIQ